MALLEVRGLRTSLFLPAGEARAIDGVTFAVDPGRTLGLVGESGCGKTMTALSILRLLPSVGRVTGGEVVFDGRNLLRLDEPQMRQVRGNDIGMIFQEPMSSLNPVLTAGEQIAEAIRAHQNLGRGAAFERAVEMLQLVDIPDAARRARNYPHQLSGGMRQRVMIAMALSCRPRILIADEPTTALDVTIQAQILDLLTDLQKRLGMGMILVTHDLGIVAERADEVAIMYAGKIVEKAPVEAVFASPLHPYTRGLLRSVPKAGPHRSKRLEAIPGRVPDLLQLPGGCAFRDRCPRAVAACAEAPPPLRPVAAQHAVACLRADETGWDGHASEAPE